VCRAGDTDVVKQKKISAIVTMLQALGPTAPNEVRLQLLAEMAELLGLEKTSGAINQVLSTPPQPDVVGELETKKLEADVMETVAKAEKYQSETHENYVDAMVKARGE
jgi:hypothetical protein